MPALRSIAPPGQGGPPTRWILFTVLLALGGSVVEAQDFYRERLRAGIAALDEGDPRNALIELELACFGFLEDPPLRARCKVHLFLAQLADGRRGDARETLILLGDLERRQDAYSKAEIDGARRAQFETAVEREFPDQALPAGLLPTSESAEPTEQITEDDAGEDPPEADEPAAGHDPALEAELEELRRSSRSAARDRDRDRLEQSLERGLELARRHPGHTEIQTLIGRNAYLLGRWDLASEALAGARSETALDASTLFYLAVSQHENGQREAARTTLRESLAAGLEETEFVRSYVQRILADE